MFYHRANRAPSKVDVEASEIAHRRPVSPTSGWYAGRRRQFNGWTTSTCREPSSKVAVTTGIESKKPRGFGRGNRRDLDLDYAESALGMLIIAGCACVDTNPRIPAETVHWGAPRPSKGSVFARAWARSENWPSADMTAGRSRTELRGCASAT